MYYNPHFDMCVHGTCCLFETFTNLAFIVNHAEKVLFSDF